MLTDKDLGIKKLIYNRVRQIDEEIVDDDPEYRKLSERVDQWKQRIAAKLPPEDQQLLEVYEGCWLALVCRHKEIHFSEGLTEGMIFGYWVAMIGQGVETMKVWNF